MHTLACLDVDGKVIWSCEVAGRTDAILLFGAASLTNWTAYPLEAREIRSSDPAGNRMLWETRPEPDDPDREMPF